MISRSILAIEDLMNPSASEKSCESCLSAPSSTGSASRRRAPAPASGADGAAERRDPPENVAAQFLELAGEAHDVDQRRAQIVADDIGEALDFVIGLAQVGGALVDRGLQIEIVVAQPRLGLVARARRAPHQEDRDAGQRDHQRRSRRSSRARRAAGCGRRRRCAPRTAALPRRASRRRCLAIAPHGVCRSVPRAASRRRRRRRCA